MEARCVDATDTEHDEEDPNSQDSDVMIKKLGKRNQPEGERIDPQNTPKFPKNSQISSKENALFHKNSQNDFLELQLTQDATVQPTSQINSQQLFSQETQTDGNQLAVLQKS